MRNQVTVGMKYRMFCVSTDRWARPYKHPYEVEGFTGWMDSEYFSKIEKFQNYKPKGKALEEIKSAAKDPLVTVGENFAKLVPTYCAEVNALMEIPKSTLWQFNVNVAKDDYRRFYAIFQDPNSGVQRVSKFTQMVRWAIFTVIAKILNKIGFWKRGDLPTLEGLHEEDYLRTLQERK